MDDSRDIMPSDPFIYTPADFLGWAIRSGWRPDTLPVGVVYTFQAPLTRAVAADDGRFRENTDLTVSNGEMFITADGGAPVLIACLNPGAASMVTQLEHLRFLGDETRFAAIVGTAGALTRDFVIGEAVVVSSALRTDGISDRYLPPGDTVAGDEEFVAGMAAALGATHARTWTVPVPYRSTTAELEAALADGAATVEMEIASLYAAAQSLEIRAAATVVISDVNRVDDWDVDWSDTAEPLWNALLQTIDVMRDLAAS